jgi:hypothetical protein
MAFLVNIALALRLYNILENIQSQALRKAEIVQIEILTSVTLTTQKRRFILLTHTIVERLNKILLKFFL